MSSRLIVNPISGDEEALSNLPLMNEKLRQHFGDVQIVMSVGPRDAERAAAQAVREGVEHLFIAGGDGTLNEVINGAAQARSDLADLVFGVIPLGTGNDFAAALGIPDEPEAAIELFSKRNVMRVDVGLANRRYFVNVSAGGFIAEVSEAVSNEMKSVVGRMAYLLGGARVLTEYEPLKTEIDWVWEREKRHRVMTLQLFAICNAPLIGGGRPIAPLAVMNDGLFDVCLIEAVSPVDFLQLALLIGKGEHLDDARVAYFRSADIHLTFGHPASINTDGEVLKTTRCHYQILPHAAQFFAP